MNPVERLYATFNFSNPDHLIRTEFGFFAETLERWKKEGLPEKYADNPFAEGNPFNYEPTGLFCVAVLGWGQPPLYPLFEEKTLEEKPPHKIVRDPYGRIHRVLINRTDYTMPQTIGGPVGSKIDWEEKIRPRLNWQTPERWAGFEERTREAKHLRDRGTALSHVDMIGGFMYLKELLGVESFYYIFYDEPVLIHDMMEHWFNFMLHSVKHVQASASIFLLRLCEDSCYNKGLFISPAMYREFIMPYEKELFAKLRNNQDEELHILVDSDGNVEHAVPLYLEMGVDAMLPFEVAAGGDVVKYRKKYPNLVIYGGIDKTILAGPKDDIDRELERIIPFMRKTGGCVAMCDHKVPPEVSLENYIHYRSKIIKLD